MGKATTVVVVEDETLTRHLLVAALSEFEDIDVVDSAGAVEPALEAIDRHVPDVVLLDLLLGPGQSGITVGREARIRHPGVGVVVLTGRPDFGDARDVILSEGGGWSFLLKQSIDDPETIARAIRGAAAGMTVIDPVVVMNLRPWSDSPLARLTPQQLRALQLVAQGFTTDAIARRLGLAPRTVAQHLDEVYGRLNVRDRPDVSPRFSAALMYLRYSEDSTMW